MKDYAEVLESYMIAEESVGSAAAQIGIALLISAAPILGTVAGIVAGNAAAKAIINHYTKKDEAILKTRGRIAFSLYRNYFGRAIEVEATQTTIDNAAKAMKIYKEYAPKYIANIKKDISFIMTVETATELKEYLAPRVDFYKNLRNRIEKESSHISDSPNDTTFIDAKSNASDFSQFAAALAFFENTEYVANYCLFDIIPVKDYMTEHSITKTKAGQSGEIINDLMDKFGLNAWWNSAAHVVSALYALGDPLMKIKVRMR